MISIIFDFLLFLLQEVHDKYIYINVKNIITIIVAMLQI